MSKKLHYAVSAPDGAVHRFATPQAAAQKFDDLYPDGGPVENRTGDEFMHLLDEPWPIPVREVLS